MTSTEAKPPRTKLTARRSEYTLGSPGKAWLLPDGVLLRWNVGPRGGPGHLTFYRQRGLPDRWPASGEATALNITAEGIFLNDDCSAGPAPALVRGICAAAVLGHATERYIDSGDLDATIGETPADLGGAQLCAPHYDIGRTHACAMGTLRRGPAAGRYELAPSRRAELIDALALAERWHARSPGEAQEQSVEREVERTRRGAREDAAQDLRFELPTNPHQRNGAGNDQYFAVRLHWAESNGGPLGLVLGWDSPMPGACHQVLTRVPADVSPAIGAALLGEARRFIAEQHSRGELLGAIRGALGSLEAHWLIEGAPARSLAPTAAPPTRRRRR